MTQTNQTYSVTPCEGLQADRESFVVFPLNGTEGISLSRQLYTALSTCQGSGTLDQLADRSLARLRQGQDQRGWIAEALLSLLSLGLLCKIGDPEQGSGGATKEPASGITTVAFPTRDRPNLLRRAVESFSENVTDHGRHVEMVVYDDSRYVSTNSAYQTVLATSSLHGITLRYSGRRQVTQYIDELARLGLDPSVARFALLGDISHGFPSLPSTIGAARNAILLDTLGERILSVDDDVICRSARHPDFTGDLYLRAHESPREHWFFSDRREATRGALWDNSCDIVGEHEVLLGRSLRHLSGQAFDRSCNHLKYALFCEQTACITTTMSGIVGDGGNCCSSSWLLIEDPGFLRLTQNATTFASAMKDGQIIAVASANTIVHSTFFQAMCVGIANDQQLPPFFPVGRNEDGVFGFLLYLLAPHFFASHVAAAVFHDPPDVRHRPCGPQFRIAELVLSLTALVAKPYRCGSLQLLRHIGSELQYIANLPSRDFMHIIWKAGVCYLRGEIERIETALSRSPHAAPFWVQQVGKYREEIRKQMISATAFIPIELRATGNFELDLALTRRLITQASQLYSSWEDLLGAAKTLKQRDIRISHYS